uniref:Cathepsin L n=2 Tax=Lygus hesperus TaxID=30085 RepID=A0A146KWT9_LYGHE
MKLFVLATCLLVKTLAAPQVELSAEEWINFKATHGKTYQSDEEELFRQKIYLENKQLIESHNAQYEKGEVTWKLAMNQFGDMLSHEVKSSMLGFRPSANSVRNAPIHVRSNKTLPTTVDWRQSNLVTPVKNQGSCGSCWAFSTTGSLEGQLAKKTGKLVSLSEQNLVDCSKKQGNDGCNGGLMDNGFTYIKQNGGIDTEESYPYTGEDGTCNFKASNVGGSDTGFVDIKSGSEEDLQDAIANVGPISVAMDASLITFQFYSSGVYSPWFCSSTSLDHGVLAVGYGSEKTWLGGTKDYWLIKNSWGSSWGEDGFFKLVKDGKNVCGVATQASYPTV